MAARVGARRLSPGLVWRRRAIAVAIAVLVIVAGYYLWLRDSSLFAVEDVTVEGATANQEQLAAALSEAAEGMTTLHVDDAQLRRVAAQFPTVATLSTDAGLLHSLTITITERLPVGRVRSEGEPVAVAEDGYLLPGLEAGSDLPAIESGVEGVRLDAEGSAQAAILGGVPDELRGRISSSTWDPDRGGVVIEIEDVPELRFGDGNRAEAKWEAVTTVLAGDQLGSPGYVDASVPERTVSGG